MASYFRPLNLSVLPGGYAVLRFAQDAGIPSWATRGEFFSVTRSEEELSVVCPQENLPVGERAEKEWRVLKVHGPFSFDEIGVLASLVQPLANEQVSVLAISTFDTDYLLVQSDGLQKAILTLRDAGHRIVEAQ
jgi:uncharacterized protein